MLKHISKDKFINFGNDFLKVILKFKSENDGSFVESVEMKMPNRSPIKRPASTDEPQDASPCKRSKPRFCVD
jgi:hypothetical protein